MSTGGLPATGPPARADVVVVGAGIVGAAVTYHLARRGVSVVTLERAGRPGAGATGSSGGMVRAFDPDPQMAELALASLATYRDPAQWLDGAAPLHGVGAVTVADPGQEDVLRTAAATINGALATSAHVVADREAAGLGLAGGVALVEPEAGWVDPVGVTLDWVRRAVDAGARLCHGVEVTGFEDAGGRVRVLTDAGALLAERVLVAAGPWAAQLLAAVRDDVPVRSRSIQVSVVEGRPEGAEHATLVDLRTGVYARPHGPGRTLIGMPHLVWDAAVDAPPDPQHASATFAALAPYLPWLPAARLRTTVRSADAYVTPRGRPGPEPLLSGTAVPAVWSVRGWDGGGVKVAPEAGRRIAEAVVAGTGPAAPGP